MDYFNYKTFYSIFPSFIINYFTQILALGCHIIYNFLSNKHTKIVLWSICEIFITIAIFTVLSLATCYLSIIVNLREAYTSCKHMIDKEKKDKIKEELNGTVLVN